MFRGLCSISSSPLRVCVVGTGPAGFYLAKFLLKETTDARVDLVDALPTPYGLLRSGVAPDHPEVKNTSKEFSELAEDERLSFVGNVRVGEDVSVEALQSSYDAVVLAYGASADRSLGIPGENLKGSESARAFVNWYNGHPNHVDDGFGDMLKEAEDVAIVGNGNVAVDCARILAKTRNELQETDIAAHAFEALMESRVKRVHLLGRRGHVQAAFTTKEIRELTRLEDADCLVLEEELKKGQNDASMEELKEVRMKQRIEKILMEAAAKSTRSEKTRSVHVRFFLSPLELLPKNDRVGAVRCGITKLEGKAGAQKAVLTGQEETVPADLVLRSVGYRSTPIEGVPFDEERSIVRNVGGRVVDEMEKVVPGLYCAGWAKRGPTGIVGTNIPDARQTLSAILQDYESKSLPTPSSPKSIQDLTKHLRTVQTWEAWKRIDALETERGTKVGKPREKLVRINEMLDVANE